MGRFLSALRCGCYLNEAAVAVGLHRATVHRWLAVGRDTLGQDLPPLQPDRQIFCDFCDAAMRASAHAEVKMVSLWAAAAARGDWRAAKYLLARRFPERWAATKSVRIEASVSEVSMSASTSTRIQYPDQSGNPEFARLMDELNQVLWDLKPRQDAHSGSGRQT